MLLAGKIGVIPHPRDQRRRRDPRLSYSSDTLDRDKRHKILYRNRLCAVINQRIGILRIFRFHELPLHIGRTKRSRRQPEHKGQRENEYIPDKIFHAANIRKISGVHHILIEILSLTRSRQSLTTEKPSRIEKNTSLSSVTNTYSGRTHFHRGNRSSPYRRP